MPRTERGNNREIELRSVDDAKVTDSQDPDEILQQAMTAFCTADPALTGSKPKQFLVILESEWPGQGSTFSMMRSGEMKPWEALGLLQFARMQQEAEANFDEHEYEDDDAEA